METTTTFTQSTTTGVIEYTDEDGLTVSATIISAQVSNILEVGSDGGTYLNRAALSITDSQTLTVTSTIATATGSQSETVEIALENSSNASYTIDLSSLEEVTSATVTPASYTFTKSPTVGDLFVDTTSSTL